MADDIVTRLRDSVHYPCSRDFVPRDTPCEACEYREEAADEIERLRESLGNAMRLLFAKRALQTKNKLLRAAGDELVRVMFRSTRNTVSHEEWDGAMRSWKRARRG